MMRSSDTVDVISTKLVSMTKGLRLAKKTQFTQKRTNTQNPNFVLRAQNVEAKTSPCTQKRPNFEQAQQRCRYVFHRKIYDSSFSVFNSFSISICLGCMI